jgi:hypothetical protein
MLDGLPQPLAAHFPVAHEGVPRGIGACYWYLGGRWHAGQPEPATEAPGAFHSDPQGVGDLIGPLLKTGPEGVGDLVVDYYELPDRLDAASELAARIEHDVPVTEEALVALAPVEGPTAMLTRAQQLGLAST